MKIYKGLRGEIGSHLRLFNLPERLRREIVAALTFKNPDYYNAMAYSPWDHTAIPSEICLAVDYEQYVEIPRAFDANKMLSIAALAQWTAIRWEDFRTEFPVEFPPVLITPNADQQHVLRRFKAAISKELRPFGTHLFVVPTSGGKTMAQGMIAGEVGQRTLVLCKTNLIKKAWIEDMYKLYGMNENDLGEIQQKSFRLGDHITLASIATLTRRKHLWPELFANIGCLIIDETQIIGAELIREIVEACPAQYIIGMTATPTRRDGKTYILNNYVGLPVLRIFNKQRETENSYPLSDAKIIRTGFRYDDEKGNPIDREDLDLNELQDEMTDDAARNQVLVDNIKADWLAGHSVLCATPRVAHVRELHRLLLKNGVEDANILMGSTNTNTFYTDKLIEAIMSRKCRCVVATTQAIKLGANLNPLDRLHVCFPPGNKEDLEQLIGRIRRKHPSKKDAKLVWYHDICVPYLHRKFKSVFFPVMRKLHVPRFENMYVA